MAKQINAILVIYFHPFAANASTIMDHVRSFERHSSLNAISINTLERFPSYLKKYEFSVILFHYSLFGLPISIHKKFLNYINSCNHSYKIAFLQDEHRYWNERSDFLNRYKIDCVYTLLEEEWLDDTYRKKTTVKDIKHNIPGYVSLEIEQMTEKFSKPEVERTIDIGYRGRRLPYYMGRASQEKHLIGVEFKKRAKHLGLALDIETDEEKRIYGDDWPKFIANCKAVLGVEAGVSVFDIDDEVRPIYAKIVEGHPDISFPDIPFEEVYEKVLKPHEDRIYYRTISPRHFEAASLRVCQILFEGKYSGILQPMKHYIPLKKDFSNFDTVIKLYKDPRVRKELTENAYKDLIASGKYTYKRFIAKFDQHLNGQGIVTRPDLNNMRHIQRIRRRLTINKAIYKRWLYIRYAPFPGKRIWQTIRYSPFPGRKFLRSVYRSIMKA